MQMNRWNMRELVSRCIPATLMFVLVNGMMGIGCGNVVMTTDGTETPTPTTDADGDQFPASEDCDDHNNSVYPEASEVPYDRIDQDCSGADLTDVDGDGVAGGPDGLDCNDADAAIHPGATEVCDTIDNNCDGKTDDSSSEDALIWYADRDQDGYGDPDVSTHACQQPAGYTANADDCDDHDKDINPAATEVCDTIDNNCDGQVDESSSTDALTWYADQDQDGYGDPDVNTQACQQPAGFSASADDCDDTKGGINPSAVEQCDEVDNDCDGQVDDLCWDGQDARWDVSVWQ